MIRHCGGFGRNQIVDNLETEAEGCMTPKYLLSPISSLLSHLTHRGVELWPSPYI